MTAMDSMAVIERAAVIGTDLMRHGIALEFAVAGQQAAITAASATALEQGPAWTPWPASASRAARIRRHGATTALQRVTGSATMEV